MQKTNPCFTLPQTDIVSSMDDAQRVPSCLVRIHPAGLSGSHIALGRESVTFGRSHDSKIEISDDFISRNHAVIEVRGADYVVRDLGSMNGTFVNDMRIVEKRLALETKFASERTSSSFSHPTTSKPNTTRLSIR